MYFLSTRYASGRTTGIVLDSGDGVSHAVPVYEGFAMPSAIRRIDVAGRDVTENLQVLLRKAGAVFHTSAEKEVVRLMKEKACYIALDPKKEEKDWAGGGSGRVEEYRLPDGHVLRVRHPCYVQQRHIIDMYWDSLAQNGLELRKFCLTPRLSVSSIRGFTKLS